MASLTFSNKITISRILTVPFFVLALLYYSPERDYLRLIALGLFLFAVISDVIDGDLARRRQEETRIGAILDPLADKILLISAFLCLYKIGHLLPVIRFPLWLIVAVISRDFILLVGSIIIYAQPGNRIVEVTPWGKWTTFFQVISVAGILGQWMFAFFSWYFVLAFTIISGFDYILKGIKLMNTPFQPLSREEKHPSRLRSQWLEN